MTFSDGSSWSLVRRLQYSYVTLILVLSLADLHDVNLMQPISLPMCTKISYQLADTLRYRKRERERERERERDVSAITDLLR